MVRTREDLAVRLSGLVVGPKEETREVVVQLDSDVETGDIYVGGTGGWDRYFKQYDMHFKVKRRVGLAWGAGMKRVSEEAPTALIERRVR